MAKYEVERMGQKRILVGRPAKQSVADMLDNVYQILGNQIQMLKNRSVIDELDGKDAAKLHKYALTLQLLTTQEEKHTAQYALDTYSDADLKKLTDKIENDGGDSP